MKTPRVLPLWARGSWHEGEARWEFLRALSLFLSGKKLPDLPLDPQLDVFVVDSSNDAFASRTNAALKSGSCSNDGALFLARFGKWAKECRATRSPKQFSPGPPIADLSSKTCSGEITR